MKIRILEFVMNSNYERIRDGNGFDSNKKPYTEKFILKIIDFFLEKEDYEKCSILKNFLKRKKNHEAYYKKYD